MPNPAGAYDAIIASVLSSLTAARGSVDAAMAQVVLGANKPQPEGRVLFLYDESDERLKPAKEIGALLDPAARIVAIHSWGKLAEELRKQSPIDKLTIWGHGAPGSPAIGGKHEPPAVLRDLFADAKAKVTGSILWAGCETMVKPSDMSVIFSRIAQAKAVIIGYTYFMVPSAKAIDAPKGATVEKVQEQIDKDQGYWIVQPDAKKIAGKGRTVHYQRWFREDASGDKLPEDASKRDKFVKESALVPKTLATLEDAQAFETELATPAHHPGFKVTVTNIPAVAGTAGPKPP